MFGRLPRAARWLVTSCLCLGAIQGISFSQTCPTIPGPPPPSPPSAYQSLYTTLNTDLTNFNTTLNGLWNGSTYPVVYAGNLQNANGDTGPSLAGGAGPTMELQALKAQGVQAVMVQVGFPIIYQPFYTYLSTLPVPPPAAFQNLQYQSFVNYYQQLAASV